MKTRKDFLERELLPKVASLSTSSKYRQPLGGGVIAGNCLFTKGRSPAVSKTSSLSKSQGQMMRKWEALVESEYGGRFSGLIIGWQHLWSRSWESHTSWGVGSGWPGAGATGTSYIFLLKDHVNVNHNVQVNKFSKNEYALVTCTQIKTQSISTFPISPCAPSSPYLLPRDSPSKLNSNRLD